MHTSHSSEIRMIQEFRTVRRVEPARSCTPICPRSNKLCATCPEELQVQRMNTCLERFLESERQRVMSALRCKYKLKHEWICSQARDKVRLLGRWLLKTAKGFAAFALCNDGKHAEQLQVLVGLGKESKECQVPLALADRDAGGGEEIAKGSEEQWDSYPGWPGTA
eukprot:6106164-Amphidinium_carterae.2